MDVKQYYRKIREIETTLADRFPLLVSLETSDGGKPGIVSEVARAQAAVLLVEGRAALASEEQKKEYRLQQAAAWKAAEEAKLARTVQVAILTDPELRARPARKSSDQDGMEK